MALIKIKQINNSPATTGGLIVYDGNNNVWSNNDDGAIQASAGTTAQRPPTGVDGMIRFNSTLACFEGFLGGQWICFNSQGSAVGNTYQHQFVGGEKDAWMFFADSNSTPPTGAESIGAVSPAIFPFDATATSLTFSNKNDNVDVDVQLFKNGTLFFTWSVINAHTAFKTTGLTGVTYTAGDRIGVFLDDVVTGSDAGQVTIVVTYEVSTINTTDGNTPTIP